MIQKVTDKPQIAFDKGLSTIDNILSLKEGQSPNCMNDKYNFDGSLEKRAGMNTQNLTVITALTSGYGMFDYGAGASTRWLIVGAGSGIYGSTNLGVSFCIIATDRTAGLMHFERSKVYLISTTENYDQPLFWAGSGTTYMSALAVNSAPLAKYCVDFNGYTMFMNTQANKRRITYADNNAILTDPYDNYFELPSSYDDEITTWIIYKGKFYVSTKYKLFAISFVGGNPDFAYKEIKSWGYIPRTVRKITMPGGIGEVIIGLCWDKRIRIFDGSDDMIISDNVERNNGICDFALSRINDGARQNCHAEVDTNEQLYKLAVPITSNAIHYTLCYNYRIGAMFPYSNTKFLSMIMAESGGKQNFVGATYDGYVVLTDTGNTDWGTGINDIYDSPLLYKNTPKEVTKQQKMSLFFSPTSSGTLDYYDRRNFSTVWGAKKDTITLISTNSVNQIEKTIDIPQTTNVYQYRITSNSNKANPWRLNRTDLFSTVMGIGKA